MLEPGGRTSLHRYGESETAIYLIRGVTRWRVGDRLDEVREARAGDFIPPHLVHWEQNASDTEPVEMVVVRRKRSSWRGERHAPLPLAPLIGPL